MPAWCSPADRRHAEFRRRAVNSVATLAVNVGGTGEFTNATSGPAPVGGLVSGVGGQGGGVAWASGSILGLDTTNAGGSFELSRATLAARSA